MIAYTGLLANFGITNQIQHIRFTDEQLKLQNMKHRYENTTSYIIFWRTFIVNIKARDIPLKFTL